MLINSGLQTFFHLSNDELYKATADDIVLREPKNMNAVLPTLSVVKSGDHFYEPTLAINVRLLGIT